MASSSNSFSSPATLAEAPGGDPDSDQPPQKVVACESKHRSGLWAHRGRPAAAPLERPLPLPPPPTRERFPTVVQACCWLSEAGLTWKRSSKRWAGPGGAASEVTPSCRQPVTALPLSSQLPHPPLPPPPTSAGARRGARPLRCNSRAAAPGGLGRLHRPCRGAGLCRPAGCHVPGFPPLLPCAPAPAGPEPRGFPQVRQELLLCQLGG